MLDWELKKLEAAEIVPIESLPDDQHFYWNDQFFPREAFGSVFGGEPPEFVFVCDKVFFQIDIDNAIQNESENRHYCDNYEITENLVDREELELFISKWNAKQTAHTWHPDYKRKVRVPE